MAGVQEFDSRGLSSRRFYLQCVLCQDHLAEEGYVFQSGRNANYYRMLLVNPMLADPTMSSKATKAALQNLEHSEPTAAIKAIMDRAVVPTRRALRMLADVVESPASSTSDSDTSEVEDSPDGDVIAAPPPPMPMHASGAIVFHADLDDKPYPNTIFGHMVHIESHKDPDGTVRQSGLRVFCKDPAHGNCSKYRSLKLGVGTHGKQAPVFYLAAWLFSPDKHCEKRWQPDKAAVANMFDTYGEIVA